MNRRQWIVAGAALAAAGCAVHPMTTGRRGLPPACCATSTCLDLHAEPSFRDPQTLLAEGERHVAAVSAFLRLPPPAAPARHVRVYLFPSRRRLRVYLARACPRQWDRAAACFETEEGYVVALAEEWRRDETLRYLRHELTHYVVASHFGCLPPWIDEGLAQYAEVGLPPEPSARPRLGWVAAWITAPSVRALEALVAVRPGGRLSRAQYRHALLLVRCLLEDQRLGPERVLEYLRSAPGGIPPGEGFRACFGLPPGEFAGPLRASLTKG